MEKYDKAPTPTASVKASSAKASVPTKDAATGFPSSPFKVGDEVRVVKDGDGGHNVGTAGVITEANSQRSVGVKANGTVRWHQAKNLAPARYVPEVGDVVEFECEGKSLTGIVYRHATAGLMAENGSNGCFYIDDSDLSNCVINKKVGHVDTMKGVTGAIDAMRIAKAYFAQPTFTGSYAERQKQWVEYYGLKVGSKVKVVREYKAHEDGATCSDWKCGHKDHINEGKIGEITDIPEGYIDVDNWTCPYFALEPADK